MQSILLSRRRALVGAVLLLAALLVGGRLLARAGASSESAPPPALEVEAPARAPKLLVHVVGAVRRPGLYRLREGSRVADAVERAGGSTPRADLELLNLAAPVVDGTQVVVPRRAPPSAPPGASEPAAAGSAGAPLHLNTATAEQLDELPGVGPVTAAKIVEYREKHGAFASVDELDAVPGIGPTRLEELRELVVP